jgi:hypothetical protein
LSTSLSRSTATATTPLLTISVNVSLALYVIYPGDFLTLDVTASTLRIISLLIGAGISREKILSVTFRSGSIIVEIVFVDSPSFEMAYALAVSNQVVLNMNDTAVSNCAVCNVTLSACEVSNVAECSESKFMFAPFMSCLPHVTIFCFHFSITICLV